MSFPPLLRPTAPLLLLVFGCQDVAIVQQPEHEGDDPGECSDDGDNDEDGLFDCDDPDCSLHPECAPNEPPTAPVVEVTPLNPTTVDGLACTMTTPAEDPDGDPITYAFGWQVDGVDAGIEDSEQSAVPAERTTREETWTCVANAHDGHEYGPGGTASVVIANTPPEAPEVSIHPGSPRLEDDLTCVIETESFDADGDNPDYSFEWLVDDVPSGITGDSLDFLYTSVDDEWTCRVVPNDGTVDGPAGEWSVLVHQDLFPHVSAGARHTCGVAIDTTLICWGITSGATEDAGQVSDTPQGAWHLVTAGGRHTCAAEGNLTLDCWGDDTHNQTVAPLGTYHSISAGTDHTCAVATDGTLSCWGTALTWPTAAPAGPFREVSSGHEHSCMVRVDQTLACWNAPYSVPTGQFMDVAAGDGHACGIRMDGSIECFGANDQNQVGAAPGGTGWTALSAGANHTCAVDADRFVTCWGANGHGQSSEAPGQFDQVDAGLFHSCGVRPDGSIVCWGCTGEDFGQCSP